MLLCGPSLAGKSTAACALANAFDATVVSADEINAQRGLPFGGEGLPESAWAETLRIQLTQLHECGRRGLNVVVDDTLCYRWLRDRFRDEVTKAGMAHVLLVFPVSETELLARHRRLADNKSRPVLGQASLRAHIACFEWPSPEESALDVRDPEAAPAIVQAHLPALRR